jgi:Uma2 family endonuclease
MLVRMHVVLDRPLDLEDLDATPDDGNRYEVLDGAIVMTPPPGTSHQGTSGELFVLLREAARPLGLRTFTAPVAWRIGPGQVPELDLIVAAADAVTERAIVAPPLLAVEVLSPSNRHRDLSEKRRIYAEGGAAWYWIVDPTVPSLTVLRLAGDGYEEAASVAGTDAYVTGDPFAVRVVPAELLA